MSATAPRPAPVGNDGPLTERSGLALARAIREGETTAREVLEAHVELLERSNPRVNALVVERIEDARRDADAADERVASASDRAGLPPLLGVPATVKESIQVAGMPNCAGLVARAGWRSERTAPAAQRLLDTGVLLLGLTNTSEMCMWVESENRHYGRTHNPYDPARTAGGSSGGEGAAIGAGFSVLGIGSDVGGSIRIPAFCSGVFGHKPTAGLVPLTGAWPEARGHSARLLVNGPLARRAEDLMPLLEILAGPDGEDETVHEAALGDPAEVSFAGMPVLVSEKAFLSPVSAEMVAARERAAGALAALGADVQRRELPELRRAFELYMAALSDGGNASLAAILLEEGVESLGARGYLSRGGPHTVSTRMTLLVERMQRVLPPRLTQRALAAGDAFRAELAGTIGDGVLLHPTMPAAAPKHGRTIGRTWWIHPCAVFNLGGNPVTQVPLGIGGKGVPVGVQVVGRPDADHVTIAVGQALERVFGGWVPPEHDG